MASLVEIGEVSAKAAEEADQKARPEAGGAPANGQSEDSKQASAGIPKVDETAKVADANAVAKPDEKAATAAGKAPLSEPKAAALEGGTPPERGADSQNETSQETAFGLCFYQRIVDLLRKADAPRTCLRSRIFRKHLELRQDVHRA